jgi:hypothetical protein
MHPGAWLRHAVGTVQPAAGMPSTLGAMALAVGVLGASSGVAAATERPQSQAHGQQLSARLPGRCCMCLTAVFQYLLMDPCHTSVPGLLQVWLFADMRCPVGPLIPFPPRGPRNSRSRLARILKSHICCFQVAAWQEDARAPPKPALDCFPGPNASRLRVLSLSLVSTHTEQHKVCP